MGGIKLSGDTKKEAQHKRPQKTRQFVHLSGITGVSGLMIISRRKRRLKKPSTDKESIFVECHNPEIHSSEHRGQGEIRKEDVVSCMWREQGTYGIAS